MLNESQVEAGKDIQQRTGKTFYFATRLLPERVRHATYVLYAFFRVADEVVDADGRAAADRSARATGGRFARPRSGARPGRDRRRAVLSAFAEPELTVSTPTT